MADALSVHPPASPLYRVGRAPDPLAWPDWQYADPATATFGNRWDDPRGLYRVLHTSASRLGCYLECLSRFRPDPQVVAGLEAIEDNGKLPPTAAAGIVPADWAANRMIGRVDVAKGIFADVAASDSLGILNRQMAAVLIEFNFSELDAATLRLKAPRDFTQRVSRFVFEASTKTGDPFSGIYYRSRLGDDIENFALFEGPGRWILANEAKQPIELDDLDLIEALRILGIAIGD